MAKTYQIAVVGDWESVMGFRALGLSTYPVTSVDEAKKTIHDLAKADVQVIGGVHVEPVVVFRGRHVGAKDCVRGKGHRHIELEQPTAL